MQSKHTNLPPQRIDFQNPFFFSARKVVEIIRKEGHSAYWAGGVVRDLLLNKEIRDIDIASSARPEQIQKIFPRTIPVGVQFGVIVVLYRGFQFEVATFRSDGSYEDGRRPSKVYFSDIQKDALRRDFTINGMYLDPLSLEITDFVQGQEDLQKKIIRTIGDPKQRFKEDKLRLLRAPRFALQLGFQIESATLKQVQSMATQINVVAKERIQEELNKMFSRVEIKSGFDYLSKTGLLVEIFPFYKILAKRKISESKWFSEQLSQVKQNESISESKSQNRKMAQGLLLDISFFDHVFKSLSFAEEIFQRRDSQGEDLYEFWQEMFKAKDLFRLPFVLALYLQHLPIVAEETEKLPVENQEIAKLSLGTTQERSWKLEAVERFLRDMKYSNEILKQVIDILASAETMLHWHSVRISTLKRWIRDDRFLLKLFFCVCRFESLGVNTGMLSFFKEKLLEYKTEDLSPKVFLSGKDLIGLGYKPGPSFSEVLTELENLQLEEQIQNREEALDFVKGYLQELS